MKALKVMGENDIQLHEINLKNCCLNIQIIFMPLKVLGRVLEEVTSVGRNLGFEGNYDYLEGSTSLS